MDNTSITPEILELLSRITNQNLRPEQVTRSVVFTGALITLILGVIYVDKTVREAEKQKLQTVLQEIAPPGSQLRPWMQQLLHGIQQQKIYSNLNDLMTLTSPLSGSEKLLLISLAYEVAAIDHHVHLKEKNYLTTIAQQLSINLNLFEVLEAGFCHTRICNEQILLEFKAQFKPSYFTSLDSGLINTVNNILEKIPLEQLDNKHTVSVDVQESVTQLKKFIELGLDELNNLEKFIKNKPNIAQLDPQEIWLKISECSGYYVCLQNMAVSLKTEAVNTVHENWPEWVKNQETPLKQQWLSYPKPEIQDTDDQKQTAELYAQTFIQFIKEEIANWLTQIIKNHLEPVDSRLGLMLESISNFAEILGYEFGADLVVKINDQIQPIGTPLDTLTEDLGQSLFSFNLREFAADLAGSVLGLLGGVTGVLGGVTGVFFKNNSSQEKSSPILQKVFTKGWENFNQSQGKILERIEEMVTFLIDHRIENARQITEETLHAYEELLLIQQRYQKEPLKQQETDQLFITEKREKLSKLKQELEWVLPN